MSPTSHVGASTSMDRRPRGADLRHPKPIMSPSYRPAPSRSGPRPRRTMSGFGQHGPSAAWGRPTASETDQVSETSAGSGSVGATSPTDDAGLRPTWTVGRVGPTYGIRNRSCLQAIDRHRVGRGHVPDGRCRASANIDRRPRGADLRHPKPITSSRHRPVPSRSGPRPRRTMSGFGRHGPSAAWGRPTASETNQVSEASTGTE